VGEGIATPSPGGRGNSYALSHRERVGVRARKTENHFGSSIKAIFLK